MIDVSALLDHASRFLAAGSWDREFLAQHVDARLANPDTVAIVAGQQPALGGGPLYTLAKAAQAVAMAQALSAAGRPAVPVFWCASEDHDLGEAAHADLIDRHGQVHRVTANFGPGRASLRFRAAAAGWPELLAACRRHLGPGPGEAFWLALAPQPDEALGAWQCRWLKALLPALATVEGHRLRPTWTGALTTALTAWPATELEAQRQRLLATGQPDAFGPLTTAPVFADRSSARSRLAPDEALALLAQDPGVLSPGAALRPVLQQAALPALAAVLGPGERAYHQFILPLYAALNQPLPIFLSRAPVVWWPTWAERAARKRGLAPGSIPVDPAAEISSDDTLAIDLMAWQARAAAAATSRRHLGAVSRRAGHLIEQTRRALAREQQAQSGVASLTHLANWLHPRRQPQDRTMACIQVIWEAGPAWAERLTLVQGSAPDGYAALVT